MDDYASRAKEYRERAERVRAEAEAMSSEDCKQALLRVVQDYILLAELLEKGQFRTSL